MLNSPGSVDVLLVEDNPYDAELIMHALQMVTTVSNIKWVEDGEQALDFLQGTDIFADCLAVALPKLVLLDIKLPKIDGLEVLRLLKRDQNTRDIPVVMLTSSRMENDIRVSYQFGANSYVVKPVDFIDLKETTAQLGKYWLSINETELSAMD